MIYRISFIIIPDFQLYVHLNDLPYFINHFNNITSKVQEIYFETPCKNIYEVFLGYI
jgi:hypothetical protein